MGVSSRVVISWQLAYLLDTSGTPLQLAYAPDGHRYRATIESASGTTTLWYLAGGAFRVQQSSDGTVAYRQAIMAGEVMVAQLTTRSDATSAFHYLYRGGLGSTVALTDQAGKKGRYSLSSFSQPIL